MMGIRYEANGTNSDFLVFIEQNDGESVGCTKNNNTTSTAQFVPVFTNLPFLLFSFRIGTLFLHWFMDCCISEFIYDTFNVSV